MQYMIVRAIQQQNIFQDGTLEGIAKLEQSVNNYISQGRIPQDGVTITSTNVKGSCIYELIQPMIKITAE